MKNKYLFPLGIATSLIVSGCGSSATTTETVTGQFVDTYVSGLNYTCSSGTKGVTNDTGEYTCNIGDTVEFFLGKYKLGSATASSGLVTPEVLYPSNPTAELNVAQILQTLDNNSSDGIITIPENYSVLDTITTTPESSSFDADMTSAIGVTLVTEAAAQAHLDEVEILVRLSGKTFYYAVGETDADDAYKVHTIVFNSDLSSFTSTQDANPSITTLDGNHLNLPNDNESFTLKEVTSDYLVLNVFKNTVFDKTLKFYFDKNKAEAELETLKTELTSLIVGKSKYYKNSKGAIGSRVYGTDGTYTGTFRGNTVSGTYTITNNILNIVRTSGNSNINIELTYLNTVDGVLKFDISVNGGSTFQTSSYSTEAARDAN